MEYQQTVELSSNWNFQDVAQLLEESFKIKDYVKNWPVVFSALNPELAIVLQYNKKIVAATFLLPGEWYLKNQKTFLGCAVGSVAVHPKFQGRGIGALLMQYAEQRAIDLNQDFIYLFSDLKNFYSKQNFSLVGQDEFIRFDYNKNINSDDKNIFLLKEKYFDNDQFFKKYQYKIFSRVVDQISIEESKAFWQFLVKFSPTNEQIISFLEFQKCLNLNGMELWWCCSERDNKIKAMGFYEKGVDFKNIFHGAVFEHESALFFMLYNFIEHKKTCVDCMINFCNVKLFASFTKFKTPSLFCKSLNPDISQSMLEGLFIDGRLAVRTIQSS